MFGILSDDLTGANGVAAMFTVRGMTAWTLLSPDALRAEWGPAPDVRVVDTATREAPPDAAYLAALEATRTLLGLGIPRIAKRIDTTLRGQIGAEVAAVLEALNGRAMVVVVPAAPEAGRVCVGGRVFLTGQPLGEVTGGPEEPLPLIRSQSGLSAHAVGSGAVRRGAEAVAIALREIADAGIPIAVCDAETVADVETIARGLALSGIAAVPVDPGGFMAAYLTPQPPSLAGKGESIVPEQDAHQRGSARLGTSAFGLRASGWGLGLLGSATDTAARQIACAVASGMLTVVELAPEAVHNGGVVLEQEIARACRDMAASTTPFAGVRVAAAAMDPARVSYALARVAVAALTGDHPPTGLYLSGGATARAVLDRLGARAVAVDGEVLPLAAPGHILGGPHAGLRIVTKGGMIGDERAIVRCLNALG
jgi:D-threonate/D-erythronate kinase